MFDEDATLPQEYEDKKGKECITQLKGKNLDSIRELQDTTLKSIILCEEISINYKFKIRDITGNYFVIINFSDALKINQIQMVYSSTVLNVILTIIARKKSKVSNR